MKKAILLMFMLSLIMINGCNSPQTIRFTASLREDVKGDANFTFVARSAADLCSNPLYLTHFWNSYLVREINATHSAWLVMIELTSDGKERLLNQIRKQGDSALNGIADLSCLEVLDAYNASILNISSLSKLINLVYLDLSDNFISDISHLRNLNKLMFLHLEGNPILDISALRNLIDLRSLHLDNTHIADISPLQNLTDLRTLDLRGTKISDISHLRNLTKLYALNLQGTFVSSADCESLKKDLPDADISC